VQTSQVADEPSRGVRLGPAERFHECGDRGAFAEHGNGSIFYGPAFGFLADLRALVVFFFLAFGASGAVFSSIVYRPPLFGGDTIHHSERLKMQGQRST
jgi:hypothetical protein